MAKMVNTVTGKVSSDSLGMTYIHEHIVFGYPGFQGDATLYPFKWDENLKNIVNIIKPIMEKYGLRTIVETTPNDCERKVLFCKAVSEATGLNIIPASGFYYEGEGTIYFRHRMSIVDITHEIYELFKAEVTQGIEGTGIKAGVFKLASSEGIITPYEQVFFKAAARVSSEEGIPIITHTQQGTMGPEQAELLVASGADPRRVSIGHMDVNTDLRYHLKTLAHGVYISLDRFGIQGYGGHPFDKERALVIASLCAAGHADRIMVSHDRPLGWLGREFPIPVVLKEQMSNWNWENIPKNAIPTLKKLGVSDNQINMILVENPKRFFGY